MWPALLLCMMYFMLKRGKVLCIPYYNACFGISWGFLSSTCFSLLYYYLCISCFRRGKSAMYLQCISISWDIWFLSSSLHKRTIQLIWSWQLSNPILRSPKTIYHASMGLWTRRPKVEMSLVPAKFSWYEASTSKYTPIILFFLAISPQSLG